MANLRKIYNSFEKILTSETAVPVSDIREFFDDDEVERYLVQGFKVPNKAMRLYFDILMENATEKILSLTNFVDLYFYIASILLFLILLFWTYKDWRGYEDMIYSLNLLLTVIPYDKLNEENTIQMLKGIRYF